MKRAIMMLVLAAFAAPLMVGCEKKGPLEEAGEKVDEAAKDAGRAVKDATD